MPYSVSSLGNSNDRPIVRRYTSGNSDDDDGDDDGGSDDEGGSFDGDDASGGDVSDGDDDGDDGDDDDDDDDDDAGMSVLSRCASVMMKSVASNTPALVDTARIDFVDVDVLLGVSMNDLHTTFCFSCTLS